MIYSALSLTYPAFLNFIAAYVSHFAGYVSAGFFLKLFIDVQISKAEYVSELAGYDIEDANTLIYN